jgi:3-isopropylmalate/(R)-2-methylmalate dehydratase small subunit
MLEDLKLEGFEPGSAKVGQARVIVTRANFGCGSSREHAPWVFEINDINVVIASGFARIFRQNMFNCGMLAIEVSEAVCSRLFELNDNDSAITLDFANDRFTIESANGRETFTYQISQFDKALVEAGGWVGFADARY